MTLSITILGCGSSGGVPRVGSGWGACNPADPRNRRRRCSILVEREGTDGGRTRVLIDTSPDLRDQLLDAGVDRLDAVLFTHDHADHTHGIDDLRPLVIHNRRVLPVYMDEPTSELITSRFSYCFISPPGSDYPPIVREFRITLGHRVVVDGAGGPIEAEPIRLEHGSRDALGFRFGDIAYSPDVSAIPPESVAAFENLDLWIIDALRPTPHPTHLSLPEALAWIERMKPRRAVLTNMHTDLDYETLRQALPANVTPAFDGLKLTAAADG